MFYVFIEFDGFYGKFRQSYGFTTEAARKEWASKQHPAPDEFWSDFETWEAPQEEWPGIQILA